MIAVADIQGLARALALSLEVVAMIAAVIVMVAVIVVVTFINVVPVVTLRVEEGAMTILIAVAGANLLRVRGTLVAILIEDELLFVPMLNAGTVMRPATRLDPKNVNELIINDSMTAPTYLLLLFMMM